MTRCMLSVSLLAVVLSGCLCNQAQEAIKERVAAEVVDHITEKKMNGKALEVLRNIVKTEDDLKQVEVALTDAPRAPVVNWRKLAPLLPEKLDGFVSVKALDGRSVTLGSMKATTVKRSYAAQKRKLTLEIIDTSLAPMLRVGFATWKAYSEDSTAGIKKATRVQGHTALLNWGKARQRGEVTVLVAGRFMVKAVLQPCPRPEDVVQVVKKIDLAALARTRADPKK